MIRCILFIILTFLPIFASAQGVRVKDLATIEGVRSNELVGYGLVVGLDGTGDGMRNSPFTQDKMSNILERLGVNIVGEQFRSRNVASVIVTGKLPPFARAGSRIDITVSAVGDAASLRGGTLVMTSLNAADGQIYAVGQGSIIAGGAAAEGGAARTVQGVPTTGHIPAGALVEREIEFNFLYSKVIKIALNTADFSTAHRLEKVINSHIGESIASMIDSGTISLDLRQLNRVTSAELIASIENLQIQPDVTARVVVDQRSGTIVMSENVRVSRIALSKGQLTISVNEQPYAVQPNPFSEGESVVVPRTIAEIDQQGQVALTELPSSITLTDVVSGLNAIGIDSIDLIDILQAMKAAGALHAELIVM